MAYTTIALTPAIFFSLFYLKLNVYYEVIVNIEVGKFHLACFDFTNYYSQLIWGV